MVGTLLLFLVEVASAQTNNDARALLQEIASSAQAAKSWRAEGVQITELTGRGMHLHDETRFKVAFQSPSKMLSEATADSTIGGIAGRFPSGTLRVCDGTDQWVYYTPGIGFYHSSLPVGGRCWPPFADFSRLTDNLVSATTIGTDHVQFAGGIQECELVRVEYAVTSPAGNTPALSRPIRMLCIDPAQKIILRDRTETGSASDMLSVETISYTSYERDSELPADLFQFQVPTGTFEDDGPKLPGGRIVEGGVYRMGPPVSNPALILALLSKVDPFYAEEAGQAGTYGVVLVSFNVGPEGNPENLRVARGLGHGLDERAIKTVREWHFRPGTKDGVPVTVGPLKVAVSFRRP